MKKLLSLIAGLMLCSSVAQAQVSTGPLGGFGVGAMGGSNATNIYPGGGFSAGAIVPSLVPSAAGKIWYVDGGSHCGAAHTSACSNSNDCLTPGTACLTITGTVAKTTSGVGDVIDILPATYTENVTLSKSNITLAAFAPSAPQGNNGTHLVGTAGVALTTTGQSNYIYNLEISAATGSAAVVIGDGSTSADFTRFENVSVIADSNIANPGYIIDGPDYVTIAGGELTYGVPGISLRDVAGDIVIDGVHFQKGTIDIQTVDDFIYRNIVKNCSFGDPDKAVYVDFSSTTTPGTTGNLFENNYFNVTLPLTTTQLKAGTSGIAQGNWPNGDIGTDAGIAPKTFTSSAIVSAGVLGFTASGTLYCNQIELETNATGLAAGTNFTVTSNSSFGLAVICSETVANLGASKSKPCTAGSVTPLVPFTLTNGQTLTLKCTGTDCTGAGTIKVTPVCTRRTMYAGAL